MNPLVLLSLPLSHVVTAWYPSSRKRGVAFGRPCMMTLDWHFLYDLSPIADPGCQLRALSIYKHKTNLKTNISTPSYFYPQPCEQSITPSPAITRWATFLRPLYFSW